MAFMVKKPAYDKKIGYTRREFSAIFQIYSQYVYKGLFKDFSFAEIDGRYYISFREEAGKTPLISIEKQKLGSDRSLFIATSPGEKGILKEIARSEKIESFVTQVKQKIESLSIDCSSADNVKGMLR